MRLANVVPTALPHTLEEDVEVEGKVRLSKLILNKEKPSINRTFQFKGNGHLSDKETENPLQSCLDL